MRLLAMLQSVGDRLGIIETSRPADVRNAPKVHTRSVTLAELRTEIHSSEVEALAEMPAELSVAYEKIFEAAGVETPAHGWNAARLLELLGSPELEGMDRGQTQARLAEMLGRENVEVEDLVRDAVARDQALDAYQGYVAAKVAQRRAAAQRRLAELESRMEEMRAEAGRLTEQLRLEEERWTDWCRKKRLHEESLARGVGFLVDRDVITTDEE